MYFILFVHALLVCLGYVLSSVISPPPQRTHVIQWMAAISLDLGPSLLPLLLPFLLPPLHRELADSTHTAGKDLHTLSTEAVDLMKEICGKEAFSQAYARVQMMAVKTREKRRTQAVIEVCL